MNLSSLSSARQRTSFVMRLGCCLLCISLLLCLACPPRAHAVVSETVAIAIVAAYLASCGLSLAADGMNADGTTGAITKMVQDFLDTELGGVSIGDWANTLFDAGVAIRSGVAYIPSSAAASLAKFAVWVKGKYGETPGTTAVVSSSQSFTAADGKEYAVTVIDYDSSVSGRKYSSFQLGTPIFTAVPKDEFEPFIVPITSNYSLYLYPYSYYCCYEFFPAASSPSGAMGGGIPSIYAFGNYSITLNISFCIQSDGYLGVGTLLKDDNGDFFYSIKTYQNKIRAVDLKINGGSLSVGVTKGVIIPEVIGDQALHISTGNPDITTPEEFADDVIGSVIDGDLTADAEIVDAADIPDVQPTVQPTVEPTVEPTAPPIDTDIPDIDGLGLGALGAALVSRFPFSIPWDFAKGVKLLAAPAKAPYWEVDLLEPISYRVGGWKGDTKIVIDMSQFEIIGQLSRWTSTIGFCLILASGTKRLIWTA